MDWIGASKPRIHAFAALLGLIQAAAILWAIFFIAGQVCS
jgi:hypothetical protein